jgi:predicted glycogen debranching enzyme
MYRLPDGGTLVKTLHLARAKNTVYVTYDLTQGTGPVQLRLAPYVCWKTYHTEMHPFAGFPMRSELATDSNTWQFQAVWDAPRLQMKVEGPASTLWSNAAWWHDNMVHEREQERGFDFHESLYCPAVAEITLQVGQSAHFTATIESETPLSAPVVYRDTQRHVASVFKAAKLETNEASQTQRSLALNADQFLIQTPEGRNTVLAGYPWFTDWGRDTMISLPGLCLCTGRHKVARQILLDYASHVSEGMIPNRFPDAGETPEYNTVDATLWFVRACGLYVNTARDRKFQQEMLPTLQEIVTAHQRGTRYEIRMDPDDCLLMAGELGSQLTWMDAKVNEVPVTARIGKPVEINALWIHALQVVADWAGKKAGKPYLEVAERACTAFRARFIREDGLGLYDCIHPDGSPDAAIRPNQVIAASLPSTPLVEGELRMVLEVATAELLTPYGLRTLSPSDPSYRGFYGGGPRERDGAYHQGTVWPYLLGAYIDLYRRVNGPDADITPLTTSLLEHLAEYGVGGVAEVFSGDAPHTPNGCPWQAWSVAELLRVLMW